MRLRSRVAIVTGGSRGIGAGLCEAFGREGAFVVVNFKDDSKSAHCVVQRIERAGGTAVAVQADVSNSSDVAKLVEAATERFGAVDILVNNAAMTEVHKPWHSISEGEWDQVLSVNLKSCFLCARAVYPFMRESKCGRIINISSVTYLLGRPNILHYVSSKAGIIGFTRSLAREVGSDGITVNAITPGAIATDAEASTFPDQEQLAAFLFDVQSLRRRGAAEDVAGAAVFLASDEGSFVTGQTVNVDGGWAMH